MNFVRLHLLTAMTPRAPRYFMKPPRNFPVIARLEPSKEVDELAHKVIGAAIEVHRALGPAILKTYMRRHFVLKLRIKIFHLKDNLKLLSNTRDEK